MQVPHQDQLQLSVTPIAQIVLDIECRDPMIPHLPSARLATSSLTAATPRSSTATDCLRCASRCEPGQGRRTGDQPPQKKGPNYQQRLKAAYRGLLHYVDILLPPGRAIISIHSVKRPLLAVEREGATVPVLLFG